MYGKVCGKKSACNNSDVNSMKARKAKEEKVMV